MKNKIPTIVKIASTLIIVVLIFYYILKYAFGIHFIYSSYDTIILICFIASIIYWLIYFIKKSVRFKTFKIIIVSLLLFSSLLILSFNIVFGFLSDKIVLKNSSPSGENTLIVLEGGFIDAIYKAYPVKYLIFYQVQNNGFVSNHDDWGASKITVTWENDKKAIVKIHSGFHPIQKSNSNNEIVVVF